MTDFASLGLSQPVLSAIADAGYTEPTPVQRAAIPADYLNAVFILLFGVCAMALLLGRYPSTMRRFGDYWD